MYVVGSDLADKFVFKTIFYMFISQYVNVSKQSFNNHLNLSKIIVMSSFILNLKIFSYIIICLIFIFIYNEIKHGVIQIHFLNISSIKLIDNHLETFVMVQVSSY